MRTRVERPLFVSFDFAQAVGRVGLGAQAVAPVGQAPDVELLAGQRRAVVVGPPDRQAGDRVLRAVAVVDRRRVSRAARHRSGCCRARRTTPSPTTPRRARSSASPAGSARTPRSASGRARRGRSSTPRTASASTSSSPRVNTPSPSVSPKMRWKAFRSFRGSPSPSQSFSAEFAGVSGFSSTTPEPELPMIEANRSSFTPVLFWMRISVIGRMITSGSSAGGAEPADAGVGAEAASTPTPARASEQDNRSAETAPREVRRSLMSGRRDSNPRPLAPKASALPGCATPRRSCRSSCVSWSWTRRSV